MSKHRDPFLKIKLTDLAHTLSRTNDLEVTFSFLSYYKPDEKMISVSNYWDELVDERKEAAMKSDIYLRAYGNRFFTNYNTVTQFIEASLSSHHYYQFSKQLFSLVEDLRIEKISISHRPGMSHAYSTRRDLLIKRFRERYSIHRKKQEWLDALFCATYLQLAERPVALPEPLSQLKPVLRQFSEVMPSLKSTKDVVSLVNQFNDIVPTHFSDMSSTYFTIYESNPFVDEAVSLTETPALDSEHTMKEENKEEKASHEESLPSYHEESTDDDGNNFLQFDLNQGSKTDLIGEGERKMESGDQAFASVQGEANNTSGSDFDEDMLASSDNDVGQTAKTTAIYGEANRYATLEVKKRVPISPEHINDYNTLKAHVQPMLKPLQHSIKKTIEQKKIAPRSDLHYGRLNRKLLKAITEQNPRLFYKKTEPSKRLDVTFTLLVDCSASMFNKMAETKAGIVLFHETLYSLQIPHRIVGFWEDALDADKHHQPNILHEVISFESSLLPKQGPFIMQLEPEEDNRDGYMIRRAAEAMQARPEKHKLLLVFTDGEPSAFDYIENGIVDTFEAVSKTRKMGTEVIGVFLSNGEEQDKEIDTMKKIYGTKSLIIPQVEDIPGYMTPLLKKLLLKYV